MIRLMRNGLDWSRAVVRVIIAANATTRGLVQESQSV